MNSAARSTTGHARPLRSARKRTCSILAWPFVAALGAAPAHATAPSDLCTGNPCVVSGAVTVDPGSSLDFGATTDLRFAPNAVVSTSGVAFTARSIVLEGGARIVAADYSEISLTSTDGNVELQNGVAGPSRIELSHLGPGSVEIDAYPAGNVVLDGIVDASAGAPYLSPGDVSVFAVGTISGGGQLRSSSGPGSSGGYVHLYGSTAVTTSASVDVSSPVSGGFYVIEVDTGDASVSGNIDIRGGDDSGGYVQITTYQGSVTLGGSILGTGTTGNGVFTCSGDSHIEIESAGAVTLSATAELNGIGESCQTGGLSVQAATTVTQLPGSKIAAIGLSRNYGGLIQIDAGGDVVLRNLDVGSGDTGGEVDVSSGGAVQILGPIDVGGDAGAANISGCDVYLSSGGKIDAHGSGSSATLTAGETITVAGTIQAGSQVQLVLREGAPLVTGTIKPGATTSLSPFVPDCRPGPSCTPGGTCGDGTANCGEECDEGPNNGTVGSTCSAGCVSVVPSLRIPGGGARPLDCAAEWVVAIDAADVPLDARGLPKTSLVCHDNDASCDADPAPGRCRFRLWSCFGGADPRLPCSATSVVATSVLSPKANSHVASEVAARQSIQDALTALGAPLGPGEACSPRYEIDLAAGQKPLKLKVRGALASGPKDTDSLQLSCLP